MAHRRTDPSELPPNSISPSNDAEMQDQEATKQDDSPRSHLNQSLTVASDGSTTTHTGNWVTDESSHGDVSAEKRRTPRLFGSKTYRPSERRAPDESTGLTVDLRAYERATPPGTKGAPHHGLGNRWGATWQDSAQGWVSDAAGTPAWRPVITTTDTLALWNVSTYLGVVTNAIMVETQDASVDQLNKAITRGREAALEGLVDAAVVRGAHGVVALEMSCTPIGSRLLVTATGTAVTLHEKDRVSH